MIQLKVTPVFPSSVKADKFITVLKEAGNWTISVDYNVLSPGPVSDPATAYVAVEDRSQGIFRQVSLSSLFTSTLDIDLQAIAALTGTGVLSRTADGTWALRTLQAPPAGLTITNPGGVAGNETFALANDLAALEGLGSTGIPVRSATDTWVQRSVVAGFGITITNGDGVAGNMSVAITDAELVALAGLVSAADQLPYFTGAGTASLTTLTTFARTLLDDTTQGAMQTTLGLVPGTNVQAFDADLAALAANSTAGLWTYTGAGTGAARSLTAPAAGLTITNPAGTAGNPTFALANDLAALESLGSTGLARRTGTDTWSVGALVLNAELATALDGTIKSNISGGTASPVDNSITSVLDKLFGTTQGSVIYRGSSAWAALGPGTSGNFLKTQGAAANPAWSAVPGGGDMLAANNLSDLASIPTSRVNLGVDKATLSKSANYTVLAADYGALIKLSSSATLALTAAATLGDGWKCDIRNTSTGQWIIDPNGSETVNGATTFKVYPGENFRLICDGASFYTVGTGTGLILMDTQVGSASATLDFVRFDPNRFYKYDWVFEGLYPSTSGSDVYVRISTDGGSTFLTTGYSRTILYSISGTTVGTDSAGSLAQFPLVVGPGNDVGYAITGKLSATVTGGWAYFESSHTSIDNTGTTRRLITSGGSGSGVANALRFLCSAGNINGTIRQYGYTK